MKLGHKNSTGPVFKRFAQVSGCIVPSNSKWPFFLSGFSFTGTDDTQDGRRRKGTIFVPLYYFQSVTNLFATLLIRWLPRRRVRINVNILNRKKKMAWRIITSPSQAENFAFCNAIMAYHYLSRNPNFAIETGN